MTTPANDRACPPGKPADVYLDVYPFGPCAIDLFMPKAGLDAVRLPEREGVIVHFPRGQSCCGQPAWSSGSPERARDVALAQMALFPRDWPVIAPLPRSLADLMRERNQPECHAP